MVFVPQKILPLTLFLKGMSITIDHALNGEVTIKYVSPACLSFIGSVLNVQASVAPHIRIANCYLI